MTNTFADDSHSAVIQVASPAPSTAKRSIPCIFNGMQGKRLTLELDEPLPISSVVSVKHEDVLFLGEVIACKGASAPAWSLEVKVEQILTGLQSLMALRDHLRSAGVSQPSGVMSGGTLN